MNTQNVVILTGRIPQTDKIKYEFTSGEDVSKNRLNGYVSVRRAYKKKDEQYYKEDLLKFVAFGQTATYLSNNANKGDTVQLVGSIEVSDNWVDENNVTHYGQPYIRVDAGLIIELLLIILHLHQRLTHPLFQLVILYWQKQNVI